MPRSATAMTEIALLMPLAVRRVPSIGSTATSDSAPVPSPTSSPLNSIGASSFSPSPITTTPRIATVPISRRIASTAAASAPFLSPRPTQRPAAIAAASVTRTSSSARLRSGVSGTVTASRCRLRSILRWRGRHRPLRVAAPQAASWRHQARPDTGRRVARRAPTARATVPMAPHLLRAAVRRRSTLPAQPRTRSTRARSAPRVPSPYGSG